MAPAIIDLVSSPDAPAPSHKVDTNAKSQISTIARPARALAFEAPKLKEKAFIGELISLSDSEDTDAPKPKKTAHKETSAGNDKAKGNNDFFFLSDDFDSTVNFDDLVLPAPKISIERTGMKTSTSGDNGKGGREFLFLSDDFDSTVNLDDDPFASDLPALPPLKKRKLSPSPTSVTKPQTAGEAARAAGAATYKRSLSNIEPVSKLAEPRDSGSRFKRTKSSTARLESDPICFTSSPDPFADAARKRKEKRKAIESEEEDGDIFGVEFDKKDKGKVLATSSKSNVGRGNKLLPDLSSDEDLPSIDDFLSKSSKAPSRPFERSESVLKRYSDENTKDRTAKEKEDKAKERAAKSKEKKEEKEAEKERKRQEKEEKIRERELAAEVAKVNTLKTNKKISVEEMIVDLPSCLDLKLMKLVKPQIQGLKAEATEWECTSPIIKWRRKVVAELNSETDIWDPVPLRIEKEKHVMYIIKAADFVDLVTAEEGEDLDVHVLRLKTKYDDCTIIYLIEGMSTWMKKNRTLINRKFQDAVRSHLPGESSSAPPTASQRKKKKEPEYVDEEKIEDALLKLQVVHETLIHHTPVLNETCDWILHFTQHISTIPYKCVPSPPTSFASLTIFSI